VGMAQEMLRILLGILGVVLKQQALEQPVTVRAATELVLRGWQRILGRIVTYVCLSLRID